MEIIRTDGAPAPAGHYSQAVVHGDLVYVSGTLPIDPETGETLAGRPIEQQAEQVFRNIFSILHAAGSSPDRVLRVTVYVSDIRNWAGVNEVYARLFGDHRPARTVVPTGELHHGVGVEAEAIAYR